MSVTVSWIISVCLGAGLLLIEYLLSKRKQLLLGLIPIIAVVAISLATSIHLNKVASQYETVTDVFAMQNGMEATICLKLDNQDNPVCFSNIRIIDKNGKQRDEAEVNFQENQTSCRYSGAAAHFRSKYLLNGDSLPLNIVQSKMAFYGNASISPKLPFKVGAIISIPLLLIYACNRILIRNRRLRSELKEINLKFL